VTEVERLAVAPRGDSNATRTSAAGSGFLQTLLDRSQAMRPFTDKKIALSRNLAGPASGAHLLGRVAGSDRPATPACATG
jgi:hypothetical protein